VTDDGQKQMITAHMSVTRNGKAVDGMFPARWFFRNHEQEPTTEVALRRSFADDLYLVLAGYDPQTQVSEFKVIINPLVNWIWFGVGVMIIGSFIAILPERAFAFATSRVPEGAATTTLMLIILLSGGLVSLRAQHIENAVTVMIAPKSPVEKELRSAIICMCGTCGRKRVGECTCPVAAEMRDEIAALVASGKNRDEVIQYFVAKYGSQEPLSEPIDKGFNRLAWLFPYVAGLAGVTVVGGMAIRWSRRSAHTAGADAAPVVASPELQTRLDDELRDLD
jgi:cytochrome c-type biogenesis protein CcmF